MYFVFVTRVHSVALCILPIIGFAKDLYKIGDLSDLLIDLPVIQETNCRGDDASNIYYVQKCRQSFLFSHENMNPAKRCPPKCLCRNLVCILNSHEFRSSIPEYHYCCLKGIRLRRVQSIQHRNNVQVIHLLRR